MSNPQQPTMDMVRLLLIEVMEEHAKLCPQPQACLDRFSAIAFVCHSIGVSPWQVRDIVPAMVKEYDDRCPHHGTYPFCKN